MGPSVWCVLFGCGLVPRSSGVWLVDIVVLPMELQTPSAHSSPCTHLPHTAVRLAGSPVAHECFKVEMALMRYYSMEYVTEVQLKSIRD